MGEEEESEAAESARLRRAQGKCSLCRQGCSELGAAVLCGHQSTKGLLEHAVIRGPRWTSDGTETQGHGAAAAACPDFFQQDGQEIHEDEGS